MKKKLRSLEMKFMMGTNKLLSPFNNRKAVDEGTNSGIRGTVSLIITLVVVAIVVLMGILVATNGQKGLTSTRSFFTQLWTTFTGVQ